MALQAVWDLAAILPCEEVSNFAQEAWARHQSSSTKQTLGRQTLSQDLLLLIQHPDCHTAPTSLRNLLLSGISSSPAFNATCFQFSHPPCPPTKWEVTGAGGGVLEGLWDFDSFCGHTGAKEKPPRENDSICAIPSLARNAVYADLSPNVLCTL